MGAGSKRSYKSNYNALSGVTSIFGWNTKKCLFVGVKNKYWIICHRASQQNEPPRSHVCYKNCNSTSTSMESSIVVEGFKESIPMHNIIYDKLIGNDDSSVMKNLNLTKQYGPDLNIKKIVFKSFAQKLYKPTSWNSWSTQVYKWEYCSWCELF